MIRLVEFRGIFEGEITTICSVTDKEIMHAHKSITSKERCPKCGKTNVFKFHDAKGISIVNEIKKKIYDCICPECNEQFDVEIQFFFEEDDSDELLFQCITSDNNEEIKNEAERMLRERSYSQDFIDKYKKDNIN